MDSKENLNNIMDSTRTLQISFKSQFVFKIIAEGVL